MLYNLAYVFGEKVLLGKTRHRLVERILTDNKGPPSLLLF